MMYKKWIIYLAAYVSLLFCFIKVFAYDVLEKDTMVRKQGLVASGQRVVDYKVLEKETCKELSDADYQCVFCVSCRQRQAVRIWRARCLLPEWY